MSLNRIDIYPTRIYKGYKCRPGRPYPFGATFVPGGVNFAIFSRHATACWLVLYKKGECDPLVEINIPDEYRVGNVFAMVVFDLDYEDLEYGFRMEGPYDPAEGHHFDPDNILLDPYAKAIAGREVWGAMPDWNDPYPYRARLAYDDFDWEDDHAPKIPIQDLIIYEMHVRGFTRHPSARAKHPGTFAAIRDKIPYLLELGVNCVELLPIFEFDEFEYYHRSPAGYPLLNYWGYSTLGFFAPKAGLAATGTLGMQVDELKTLVKVLHQYGIEVILDVVFNHTAEGDHRGKTISYRGIDNKTYYMLTPDGFYYNFSGTGNTLNCNHPVVRGMVLDCLRYWAAEYHIDGFRFDLASILGRDQDGTPLANPPLLETMAYDPILAKCKLIAEAWDAGGLYQVGSFPAYGRWAEWNGQYRDTLRHFLKSDEGQVPVMAQRIQGSPDLYKHRGPVASINFITCHDGFTLHDLVSYNTKHNEANGENNWDGSNDNLSWNCGVEGPTTNPQVLDLRRRQQKNAIAMLMTSQGVPMILMGDEIGRTQQGNNNTYCQDNDLSWLDWSLLETNYDQFRFFSNMIAFRKAHPLLRQPDFLNGRDAEITWHSTQAFNADWSYYSRVLAFMLSSRTNPDLDDTIYVAMNMYWEALEFELPQVGVQWYSFANTGRPTPTDIYEPGYEPLLDDQRTFVLGPRSVAIMVGL